MKIKDKECCSKRAKLKAIVHPSLCSLQLGFHLSNSKKLFQISSMNRINIWGGSGTAEKSFTPYLHASDLSIGTQFFLCILSFFVYLDAIPWQAYKLMEEEPTPFMKWGCPLVGRITCQVQICASVAGQD